MIQAIHQAHISITSILIRSLIFGYFTLILINHLILQSLLNESNFYYHLNLNFLKNRLFLFLKFMMAQEQLFHMEENHWKIIFCALDDLTFLFQKLR